MVTTADAVMHQVRAQGALEPIGSFLGRGNEGKAESAVGAVLAALVAGMAYRSSSAGGAQALLALIRSGQASALEEVAATLEQGRHGQAGALVGSLLGASRQAVEGGVADHCGISLEAATVLLPRLLPLIVAEVKRRVADDRLDRSGLTEMLIADRDALADRGFRGVVSLVGAHRDDEVEFSRSLGAALAIGDGWASTVKGENFEGGGGAEGEMVVHLRDESGLELRPGQTAIAGDEGAEAAWRRLARRVASPFRPNGGG